MAKEGTGVPFFYILNMIELIKKITAITEKKFLEEDFSDCYIVDLKISNNLKVEIFIDCDSELTINKCAAISRFIAKEIEDADLINEKFTLDVSSPGLGRPLIKRQYIKNVGKLLKIKMIDKTSIEGKLIHFEEDKITIEIQEKKDFIKKEIAFNEIEEAKIIFKF
jgi:ribosome maturation factor RimP